MASAFALAIFSGKIVLLYEWKMTAVIFHSPFHALGSRRQTAASHRTADSFSSDTSSGCGTQHPHRALGGTCVLLAAAPTATLCFRRWRRSLLLQAIPSPALLPCGQQGPTPADGPQRNCQPFCGFRFYFLIFCKCFMPSSKRLRKASTSSGVLSAQKDTRMAVSMASGSRPMAASVWLG